MKAPIENVADIDTSAGELVAFVSTERPDASRWTELSVIYLPEASGRCFVAEVTGRSRVDGEAVRRRPIYVGSLERALKLFDEDSEATHALRLAAEDWMERNADRPKQDVLRLRQAERGDAPAGTEGFSGQDGLDGALSWLYPDGPSAGRAQRLETDFGVPRRTVDNALSQEGKGEQLTGWARAFLSALRWFDRAAFHRSKGETDADPR